MATNEQPLIKADGGTVASNRAITAFGTPITAQTKEEVSHEIELIQKQEANVGIEFSSDQLNDIKRRLLIAINAYGTHDIPRIVSFVGALTGKQVKELLDSDPEVVAVIKKREMVCFTKPEIVARLCIEAETARSSKDRIAALTKLMEYRGMAAPEGGSKTFSRMVLKFQQSDDAGFGALMDAGRT
jgi:hypothetical protein